MGLGEPTPYVQAHILPVDPVLRRAQHFVQNGLRLVSSTQLFQRQRAEQRDLGDRRLIHCRLLICGTLLRCFAFARKQQTEDVINVCLLIEERLRLAIRLRHVDTVFQNRSGLIKLACLHEPHAVQDMHPCVLLRQFSLAALVNVEMRFRAAMLIASSYFLCWDSSVNLSR